MTLDIQESQAFWEAIDNLVSRSGTIIDRPKGSRHPHFNSLVYPVDYGFLADTTSMDGHGIDVWQGSVVPAAVNAIICTIDLMKKDSEIKLLIGCTPDETALVYEFHNNSEFMKGLLITRPAQPRT